MAPQIPTPDPPRPFTTLSHTPTTPRPPPAAPHAPHSAFHRRRPRRRPAPPPGPPELYAAPMADAAVRANHARYLPMPPAAPVRPAARRRQRRDSPRAAAGAGTPRAPPQAAACLPRSRFMSFIHSSAVWRDRRGHRGWDGRGRSRRCRRSGCRWCRRCWPFVLPPDQAWAVIHLDLHDQEGEPFVAHRHPCFPPTLWHCRAAPAPPPSSCIRLPSVVPSSRRPRQ